MGRAVETLTLQYMFVFDQNSKNMPEPTFGLASYQRVPHLKAATHTYQGSRHEWEEGWRPSFTNASWNPRNHDNDMTLKKTIRTPRHKRISNHFSDTSRKAMLMVEDRSPGPVDP